ncbi:hypothetical protein NDU88_009005 [Pleurodeles waltl]|uniref:Uncharacterized protein n=1 Tax=Pleurodeles waltl TaxID=8319 RepID=A0AAV7RXC9_PLEWA|nr:hypothetical protein NDU88_009005 [Pleurodeles waltl]
MAGARVRLPGCGNAKYGGAGWLPSRRMDLLPVTEEGGDMQVTVKVDAEDPDCWLSSGANEVAKLMFDLSG